MSNVWTISEPTSELITLNDFCAAGAQIKHVAGTWLAFERV